MKFLEYLKEYKNKNINECRTIGADPERAAMMDYMNEVIFNNKPKQKAESKEQEAYEQKTRTRKKSRRKKG